MKIFISHQRIDSSYSQAIAQHLLSRHGISSYLDIFDIEGSAAGDELGEHLRAQLGACTHLLAVVSASTKGSWWVPWEIGVATEKDYPLATYATGNADLPMYLKKWPFLRSYTDLDRYAEAVKQSDRVRVSRRAQTNSDTQARRYGTKDFYTRLRASLGQ